ncbi:hypothetical protein RJT34_09954 [Clitoria ternatea]|uniref:Uncharacterized protein n=1 Tax=Clitoria ternatea TaxID=43366 RepID=A0AAN9K674_CLITE
MKSLSILYSFVVDGFMVGIDRLHQKNAQVLDDQGKIHCRLKELNEKNIKLETMIDKLKTGEEEVEEEGKRLQVEMKCLRKEKAHLETKKKGLQKYLKDKDSTYKINMHLFGHVTVESFSHTVRQLIHCNYVSRLTLTELVFVTSFVEGELVSSRVNWWLRLMRKSKN